METQGKQRLIIGQYTSLEKMPRFSKLHFGRSVFHRFNSVSAEN